MHQFVDQYINYLIVEKGLANTTIESYTSDLNKYLLFLKSYKIHQISDTDAAVILKYLLVLRDNDLGIRSRARHLVTLRGFYKFLIQEKILTKDPTKIVDLPKTGVRLPDVLSVNEINTILNAPDTANPYPVYGAYALADSTLHSSEWFGTYDGQHLPWAFHELMGWLYMLGGTAEGGLYFQCNGTPLGILYTTPEYWPFLYQPGTDSWLYFLDGIDDFVSSLAFWNFSTGQLISIDG